MAHINVVQRLFLRTTGFSYTNMGRLFLRLFVGVMFMQFGIRHWANYDHLSSQFPAVLGMESATCLTLMILTEIICSAMIIIGFWTRISTIPPIISMIIAEYYIVCDLLPENVTMYGLDSTDPGYLPIMFLGIYFFIWLTGPGKISLDYVLSLRILNSLNAREEDELEEV